MNYDSRSIGSYFFIVMTVQAVLPYSGNLMSIRETRHFAHWHLPTDR